MNNDLSAYLGDNLSDVQGDNQRKPKPTMQSDIASMRKMMEDQREVLQNSKLQHTQLSVQNAEKTESNRKSRREFTRQVAMKTIILDMTHTELYSRGAQALHNLLDKLRSNVLSHGC